MPKSPARKPPRAPESDVMAAALGLLRLAGVPHFRSNAGGGWRLGKGGRPQPIKGAPEGWPDITGWLPPAARVVPDAAGGLHVAWECGGRRAELHVRADGRLAWRRVEGGVQVGLAVPVWRATASRGIDAGRGALMWMLGRTAAVTY